MTPKGKLEIWQTSSFTLFLYQQCVVAPEFLPVFQYIRNLGNVSYYCKK